MLCYAMLFYQARGLILTNRHITGCGPVLGAETHNVLYYTVLYYNTL